MEPMSTLAYDERLRVPWTWWLLGAASGALLVDEVDATLIVGQVWGGWRALSIAFFAVVFLTWMTSMSLTRVAVTSDTLLACGDRLSLAAVGETRPVDDAQRRRLMGPHGNRLAHLATRPWVKTGLLIQNVDPTDPAPYWLVSTRAPAALAAAIEAGRRPSSDPSTSAVPSSTDALAEPPAG